MRMREVLDETHTNSRFSRAPSSIAMPTSSMETLATGLAEVAALRAAGLAVGARAYEDLMLTCLHSGRGLAAYRLMEEAASEGVRLGEFSQSARELLEGMLPPEAESLAGEGQERCASDHDDSLQVDQLPPLWTTSVRSIASFDCSEPGGQLGAAWEAIASGDSPVLMRGIGSGWRALHTWRLPHLQNAVQRAMVRVASTPAVTFCRESHPAVRSGKVLPPSRTVIMDVGEFADRLHARRRGRQPLLFDDGERVYLQALATPAMMDEIELNFLPNDIREENEGRACGRLWVSAPGTVSPLHYDETDSYLCQV